MVLGSYRQRVTPGEGAMHVRLWLGSIWRGAEMEDRVPVRRFLTAGTLVRWHGLALLAIVGMIEPPRPAVLLAYVILWVAAYNAAAVYGMGRMDDASAVPLARALMLLDMFSLFLLIAIYRGDAPASLYAISVWIIVGAVLADGARGAFFAVALFLLGMVALQCCRHLFFNEPFLWTEVVLWTAITSITAASLAMATRLMLAGRVPAGLSVTPGADPLPIGGRTDARLSSRELEVLRLVATGYSNAMIARRLHLSPNTVKRHVEAVLDRLNARNRAEAVAQAAHLDLLDPPASSPTRSSLV